MFRKRLVLSEAGLNKVHGRDGIHGENVGMT